MLQALNRDNFGRLRRSRSRGTPSGKISIEEVPEIAVSGFGELNEHQIHSQFVWPLVALMTFASDGPPRMGRYQLVKETGGVGGSSQFDRLLAPSVRAAEPQPATSRDLLFTCEDLGDGFESFMQKWFDFVDTHPRFTSVFFSHGYQQTGFLEVRFLLLMQAAECLALDERSANAEVLQLFASAFQSLRGAESLATLPFAFAALPSADQMAIPTLLAKLVGDHWDQVQNVVGTARDVFLRALFATANQIMHRGDQPSGALHGTDMYWLYARLAAAIKIIVLHRLGLADSQINSIAGRNAQMNHLKSVKSPWSASAENK